MQSWSDFGLDIELCSVEHAHCPPAIFDFNSHEMVPFYQSVLMSWDPWTITNVLIRNLCLSSSTDMNPFKFVLELLHEKRKTDLNSKVCVCPFKFLFSWVWSCLALQSWSHTSVNIQDVHNEPPYAPTQYNFFRQSPSKCAIATKIPNVVYASLTSIS